MTKEERLRSLNLTRDTRPTCDCNNRLHDLVERYDHRATGVVRLTGDGLRKLVAAASSIGRRCTNENCVAHRGAEL